MAGSDKFIYVHRSRRVSRRKIIQRNNKFHSQIKNDIYIISIKAFSEGGALET
jgi:hypothetical protein